MQYWARNTALDPLFRFAATFGLAPDAICAGVGLDPAQASEMNALVPAAQVIDAIEWCAEHSGRADFGLSFADRVDLRTLGLPGLLAERANSVVAFHQQFQHNLPQHSGGWTLRFAPEAGGAAARMVVLSQGRFPVRHSAEAAMAVLARWWRRRMGGDWRPRGFEFTHPPLGSPSTYAEAFGAPLAFGAPRNAMLFSVEDLAWRAPRPHLTADHQEESQLEQLSLIERHDHVAHVASVVRALLPEDVSLKRVAAELSISSRVLQRRLADEGISFRALRDDVRLTLARDYLKHPCVKLSEVAQRLGYAHTSVLSRMLRRAGEASGRAGKTAGQRATG